MEDTMRLVYNVVYMGSISYQHMLYLVRMIFPAKPILLDILYNMTKLSQPFYYRYYM